MNPTTKLRFVERVIDSGEWGKKTQKILQQWWQGGMSMNIGFAEVPVGEQTGEWRDVPVEREEQLR